MVSFVLSAFYFLLPAYIANMLPVFAGALKFPLRIPVCTPIFGPNKTWAGVIVGYLGAVLVLWLQQTSQALDLLEPFRIIDYSTVRIWLLAVPFGLGTIGADMIKSGFKRLLHKPPGSPWFPFDQLETLVPLFLVWPLYSIGTERFLILLILSPILHALTNVVSYTIGLKKVWW